MTKPGSTFGLLLLVLATLAACAAPGKLDPPAAPAALQVGADQVLYLEVRASGVQIYECAQSVDRSDTFEWTFRAPEATLTDAAGRTLGKHYAGPTWQSTDDQSLVVAAVKARESGPDPTAIPWLLLEAKSTSGSGLFAQARSIQRLKTVGGLAPSEPCSTGNIGHVVRVPYTATYYFYRNGA